MTSHQTALVLGASGGVGGEVARRLVARGWTVRALHRNPDRLSTTDRAAGFTWLRGDAMSASDVAAAAEGASVIVHAVNPPGYRNWGRLVLPMLDNTIAAARAAAARIVLPGTVYNFGPDTFPEPQETSPQHPTTVKGGIRVEMERRLRVAADAGAPVLIVRAGDFFGPQAANNWFAQGLVRAGKPLAAITYPGRRGIGHQWAYLPDVAETMVRLLEKSDSLENFAVFHMEGHWDADGTQMVAAVRTAADNPGIKLRTLPWLPMRLLAPLVPLFRELAEMRYLWATPIHMGNARLREFLGAEPHTKLDIAVRETLIGLGCLRRRPPRRVAARPASPRARVRRQSPPAPPPGRRSQPPGRRGDTSRRRCPDHPRPGADGRAPRPPPDQGRPGPGGVPHPTRRPRRHAGLAWLGKREALSWSNNLHWSVPGGYYTT
jgi:nucleoside-diphosphate-sugar epimerase